MSSHVSVTRFVQSFRDALLVGLVVYDVIAVSIIGAPGA